MLYCTMYDTNISDGVCRCYDTLRLLQSFRREAEGDQKLGMNIVEAFTLQLPSVKLRESANSYRQHRTTCR
jgi:hypothetical protein